MGSHFLWFLPLLQQSAVTHTPLVKWPLDTPMVVSSLVLTTAMVSCLELEPLETEESSTLDSMVLVFIILENVRLNIGPSSSQPRCDHSCQPWNPWILWFGLLWQERRRCWCLHPWTSLRWSPHSQRLCYRSSP